MGGDKTKVIQTKVVLGKGKEDFFKEVDFDFAPGKELFMIQKVDKWVDVYSAKVVGGNKVIFNAWIYKNIAYKVACKPPYVDPKDGIVTVAGDIVHITKRIPLAGCIDIDECGVKLKETDMAEVLEAEVLGDVEELLCPVPLGGLLYPGMDGKDECGKGKPQPYKCEDQPMYAYKKLHEKMCIRIKVKVVRWEHIPVMVPGC